MTQDSVNPIWSPVVKGVLFFTGCYIALALLGAWYTRNIEFLFYIGVMFVIGPMVAWLHSRVRLSPGALWCLSVWGLLHMAGGLMPVPAGWPINGTKAVLYSLWLIPDFLKYDHVVHAFGFGVTTWVCWQGLKAAVRPGHTLRPTFGVLLICVAAGMGFGALNEIIEFIATLLVPNTNVGGYINTGWDLVSNFAGSVITAILLRFHGRTGSM
ncbi:MAG TPA: DUF2238 domain-containing protein [Thermoanaerobaculia bacterium]|nr:DUF2238 domain-containing protein [Thermoanaerobaculia bacterium]HUM30206.1 DUF2238 domain-containing protein [Thermoanaerobaculia bacterium]HXK68345.1 DUF2238 domain-containing protein [Thermoanaerobaculia bacterium]